MICVVWMWGLDGTDGHPDPTYNQRAYNVPHDLETVHRNKLTGRWRGSKSSKDIQ